MSDALNKRMPGGMAPKNTGRTYEIKVKDITDVAQAVPVRLVYGRQKVAGVVISPTMGFAATPVYSSGGGK